MKKTILVLCLTALVAFLANQSFAQIPSVPERAQWAAIQPDAGATSVNGDPIQVFYGWWADNDKYNISIYGFGELKNGWLAQVFINNRYEGMTFLPLDFAVKEERDPTPETRVIGRENLTIFSLHIKEPGTYNIVTKIFGKVPKTYSHEIKVKNLDFWPNLCVSSEEIRIRAQIQTCFGLQVPPGSPVLVKIGNMSTETSFVEDIYGNRYADVYLSADEYKADMEGQCHDTTICVNYGKPEQVCRTNTYCYENIENMSPCWD